MGLPCAGAVVPPCAPYLVHVNGKLLEHKPRAHRRTSLRPLARHWWQLVGTGYHWAAEHRGRGHLRASNRPR